MGVTQLWLRELGWGLFVASRDGLPFFSEIIVGLMTPVGFVQLPSQTSKGTAFLPLLCWVWK